MEFWYNLSNAGKRIFLALAGILFVLTGFFLYPFFTNEHQNGQTEIILPDKPAHVTVYVTGMVRHPGVYTMRDGSRIRDALKIAGGTLKGWNNQGINLAKRLEDEEMILVPKREEFSPETLKSNAAARETKPPLLGKISVNAASALDFEKLPGIGPSMAKKIVQFRNQHGYFRSPDDLKKVAGLGGKKFEKIKNYLEP